MGKRLTTVCHLIEWNRSDGECVMRSLAKTTLELVGQDLATRIHTDTPQDNFTDSAKPLQDLVQVIDSVFARGVQASLEPVVLVLGK